MSATIVVNGGTGDYTLEALAVAALFAVGVPLLAWLQGVLGQVVAGRARRRAVLAALAAEGRRLSVVRSPDPCRVCGDRAGWHEQGCGLLDRLDAARGAHQ